MRSLMRLLFLLLVAVVAARDCTSTTVLTRSTTHTDTSTTTSTLTKTIKQTEKTTATFTKTTTHTETSTATLTRTATHTDTTIATLTKTTTSTSILFSTSTRVKLVTSTSIVTSPVTQYRNQTIYTTQIQPATVTSSLTIFENQTIYTTQTQLQPPSTITSSFTIFDNRTIYATKTQPASTYTQPAQDQTFSYTTTRFQNQTLSFTATATITTTTTAISAKNSTVTVTTTVSPLPSRTSFQLQVNYPDYSFVNYATYPELDGGFYLNASVQSCPAASFAINETTNQLTILTGPAASYASFQYGAPIQDYSLMYFVPEGSVAASEMSGPLPCQIDLAHNLVCELANRTAAFYVGMGYFAYSIFVGTPGLTYLRDNPNGNGTTLTPINMTAVFDPATC